MPQGDLNTMSYAILGILSARDWSAYEVAEQIGRGMSEIVPRADRQRYNAPKKLVERGLVTARTEPTGTQRSRTIYSITPEGRAAITEWMATETKASTMEFEGLLRVCVADLGSIDDLRNTLRTVRAQAEMKRQVFVANARLIKTPGAGSFPGRQHVLAMSAKYMVGHFTHIISWVDWMLDEVADWPDTVTPVETHADRIQAILDGIIEEYGDSSPAQE
ncbi:PadR family transcriptional regulator [Williamsia limnetica]|uniref:PadR family transcriptional regulator n=2 Tax=Williamsia limnetica TaxID=882452 RepID=A0A318RMH2_WILLI|nr:PadR family transcriptional regulator [Williamsia limnetica]